VKMRSYNVSDFLLFCLSLTKIKELTK